MTSRRNAMLGILASSLELSATNVFAQDTSPITILVGAASSMDFGARAVAEQMRDVLGRPVVVVSKLGAGQRIALGEVKRAQPDGRTLVFATSGPFAVYPHVYN
jgi:tripartite-type tricarboxylate transporter receptor subunit TctC